MVEDGITRRVQPRYMLQDFIGTIETETYLKPYKKRYVRRTITHSPASLYLKSKVEKYFSWVIVKSQKKATEQNNVEATQDDRVPRSE